MKEYQTPSTYSMLKNWSKYNSYDVLMFFIQWYFIFKHKLMLGYYVSGMYDSMRTDWTNRSSNPNPIRHLVQIMKSGRTYISAKLQDL